MKQPIKGLILLFIASAMFVSCGEQVAEINRHFIGVWYGSDGTSSYSLSIDNGSNGYWHQDNHGVFSTAQGIARIRHNKLYIGLRPFNILQYPMQDSLGKWTINLSGVIYQKQ